MWIWIQHSTSRQPFIHVHHTFGSWKYCVVGKQYDNPFFFTLPRYAILFRVTTAPTTKKLTTLPMHRSVKQLNNQLDFLLMCFVVVFDSNYVVLFWAAGCRIATTEPLCDEAVCTTHFHFKREQFAFAFQFVDCWGVLRNVFSLQFLFVFVVDHFEMWLVREDDAIGAAMWRFFFAGLTLISIGLIDFWMNISFSVREFVLKGFALFSRCIISERLLVRGRCKRVPLCDEFFCWSHLGLNRFSRFLDEHFVFCLRTCFAGWCRCVSKLFFVFMVLFCLRSRSRLTIP